MFKKDTTYRVRLTRLYWPKPKVIWEGETTFHLQFRPNGDIGVLAIKDGPYANTWAEYSVEDLDNGKFIVEDYMMEIL